MHLPQVRARDARGNRSRDCLLKLWAEAAATASFLTGACAISRSQVGEVFEDVLGAPISVGSVSISIRLKTHRPCALHWQVALNSTRCIAPIPACVGSQLGGHERPRSSTASRTVMLS
jgi:hypothetical protein